MNDNLSIWKKVCTTDPKFAKQFTKGGGFSGTSANPMYLAEEATRLFGPVGIGWGHSELERTIVEHPEGSSVWMVHVEFWYVHGDKRGHVSQWGSSPLLQSRGKGDNKYLFLDDEAAKKARTNAVSKCMSLLGFSADLWLGYYDSPQYRNEAGKEHQNRAAFDRMQTLLNTGIGCETPEDYDAVVSWATDGEVPNYETAMETAEAPIQVQKGIKQKGLTYPKVLEAARKAASKA